MTTLVTLAHHEMARMEQLAAGCHALSRAYSLPKILFESTAWTPEMEELSAVLLGGEGLAKRAHRLFEAAHGGYMAAYNDVIVQATNHEKQLKTAAKHSIKLIQEWLEARPPEPFHLPSLPLKDMDGAPYQPQPEEDAWTAFAWIGLLQPFQGGSSILERFLIQAFDANYDCFQDNSQTSLELWAAAEHLIRLIGSADGAHDPLQIRLGDASEGAAEWLNIAWPEERETLLDSWRQNPAWQALECRACAQAIRRAYGLLPARHLNPTQLEKLAEKHPCGENQAYAASDMGKNPALMSVLQPSIPFTSPPANDNPPEDPSQHAAWNAARYLDGLAEQLYPVLTKAEPVRPVGKRLLGEVVGGMEELHYRSAAYDWLAAALAMPVDSNTPNYSQLTL